MKGRAQLLTVDGVANLFFGVALVAFPRSFFEALGLPWTGRGHYPTILGGVLVGIGVALLLESRDRVGGLVGLGLGGAVAINLSAGLAIAAWLLLPGADATSREDGPCSGSWCSSWSVSAPPRSSFIGARARTLHSMTALATVKRFHWKLVAALAPLGLVFAALTITGSIHGVNATRWVALGLLAIAGVAVALRAPGRPLRHGFAAGFFAGLVAVETQAVFLGTYFANNPQYADLEMPFGLSPRLAVFILGPINALLAGLIAAAVGWPVWKALRASEEKERSP